MMFDDFLHSLQVQHTAPARVEIYRRELGEFADFLETQRLNLVQLSIDELFGYVLTKLDPFLDRPGTYWMLVSLADLFRHQAFVVRRDQARLVPQTARSNPLPRQQ